MLCCILPLVLLGLVRRALRLDRRGPSPMPPPARRDVDLDPDLDPDGPGRSLVGPVR